MGDDGLWGKKGRGPAGRACAVAVEDLCEAEIDDADGERGAGGEDDVLGLDVAVDDAARVEVADAREELCHDERCVGFAKVGETADGSKELSAAAVLHDEVDVRVGLVDLVEGDKDAVVLVRVACDLAEDADLGGNLAEIGCVHAGLVDLLAGKDARVGLAGDRPDHRERPCPQHRVFQEVVCMPRVASHRARHNPLLVEVFGEVGGRGDAQSHPERAKRAQRAE